MTPSISSSAKSAPSSADSRACAASSGGSPPISRSASQSVTARSGSFASSSAARNQMPFLGSRRTMPSRFSPRTSSLSRNGLPCVPATSVSSATAGMCSSGEQQPARQLGGRVGAERAELQAKVRAAALAPARLHLRQRRPRRDRTPTAARRASGMVAYSIASSVASSAKCASSRITASGRFARQPAQRLAHAAADGRAQHAGRRAQRAQLRLVGRHPAQRQRRRGPQRRAQLAQQRLPRSAGLSAGSVKQRPSNARRLPSPSPSIGSRARSSTIAGVADGGSHLLDQRRAQVGLAEPAVRQHRRQARASACRRSARAAADQAVHLFAAADQRRLRRPHDGQRVVFARRRQRRDQRAVGGGGAAPLGHQIGRRGGQEQPAAGLRLDLLEQARERGAHVAVAAVGLLAGRDRRQIDDHAAARLARDQRIGQPDRARDGVLAGLLAEQPDAAAAAGFARWPPPDASALLSASTGMPLTASNAIGLRAGRRGGGLRVGGGRRRGQAAARPSRCATAPAPPRTPPPARRSTCSGVPDPWPGSGG